MPSEARRLFLALWPGPATRRALGAERARWPASPDARFVADADLHLTLHFLGAVPAAEVGPLVRALAVAAPRFTLQPTRHAQWDERVAVLETAPTGTGLPMLHARLADALRAQGLAVQTRTFRPHVTLARTRRALAAPGGVGNWRWPVRSYVLAESRPGQPYRLLARFPLGTASAQQASMR
jgi:2'-5' RNA ligase